MVIIYGSRGGAVETGGDIESECNQLEGGGKFSVHTFRGGQTLRTHTSDCHLQATKISVRRFGGGDINVVRITGETNMQAIYHTLFSIFD